MPTGSIVGTDNAGRRHNNRARKETHAALGGVEKNLARGVVSGLALVVYGVETGTR
jgi:hypothetical protein